MTIHEKINIEPNWFGIPMIIEQKFLKNKEIFFKQLQNNGIENRPIISGNFVNQPSFNLYKFKDFNYKKTLKNAQLVHEGGFYIGIQNKKISNELADYVVENLLKIKA